MTTTGRFTTIHMRSNLIVAVALLILATGVHAADYTWDVSTTAGSQSGSGSWESSYWTLTGGGGTTLVAWPGTGNSATFEGVDGTYSIMLSSTQSVDSITFLFSGYSIDGGTIDAGSGLDIFTDSAKTATINSPVTGSAGLSKFGKGTVVLSGANTFTGPVLFAGGTLSVAAIDNGGISGPLGSGTNAASSLVFNGGALEYTGAAQSTDRLFTVEINGGSILNNGSGALSFTNTGSIGLVSAGSRTLILGGSSSAGNMLAASISENGGITSLQKDGTGTWILTGTHTYTGHTVINAGMLQIGGGGTTGSISSSDSIITNGTLVFNRSDGITLSAPVTGTGTLVKNGTGSLTITDSCGYIGTTTISSGILRIGDGGTTGALNSVGGITNNSALELERSDLVDYGGIISGTGSVTKNGTGTLILSGTNTYTGATTVSAGSLLVAGTVDAGSAVSVITGATLGGNGAVNGVITVQNGGVLAPGIGAAGKLTTGGLTLGSTSSLECELGTFSDTIAVNGDLTLDGDLNITELSGYAAGTYRLMTYTGTLTDNVLSVASAPGGYTYTVTASGGVVDLTVTAIGVTTWIGGAGNNLWSSATNWSGAAVPTSVDSVVFSSSSYPCSLDVDPTVRCLMFEAGYTQTFYLNGHKLTVNKDLSINMTGTVFSNGNDTICFGGNESGVFVPKWGMPLPQLQRTGTGVTTVSTTGFRASGLLVTGGEFNFGYGVADTVDSQITVAGGSVHFASCTLYVAGDVDFSGATAVVPDQGVLDFNGVSPQLFYPGNETPHPMIRHSGADTLFVRNNRLRVGIMEIQGGTVVLDTALFADSVSVLSTTVLRFDTAAGNQDTIRALSGSGDLDLGNTELFISSSLPLNLFTSISGTGTLSFFGTDAIFFEPNSGYLIEKITKQGSGTVQVGSYNLIANNLVIEEGVWDWYTSGIDTVYDSITINGGQMALYNSSVYTGTVRANGGTLQCNSGRVVLFGSGGVADLSGLSALSADSGGIDFNGAGTSVFTLISNGSLLLPPVTINGTSLDTVKFGSAIQAKSLRLQAGICELGSAFSHTVDTVFATGGTMDFGSSTLSIAVGDADFSGLSSVVPGSGSIVLSGSSQLRYLTPPSVSLPPIEKSGVDTVMISAVPLICDGLTVNDGVFDFEGRNVTVNGNLSFSSGTDTMVSGLDGITVTVSGDASFNGQSGSMLDLSPVSAWTLSVTGALQADYAVIANCDASGGVQGQASVNCTDSGGNTNWYFTPPDTFPPDNPMTLAAAALSTTELEVTWNPSAVAAVDADSVGLWYKTTDFPDSADDVTATLIGRYSLADSVQTVTGLSSYTLYYIAAAVRDTLGQWSDVNSATDTEYTYAEPPTAGSPLDTVHRKEVPVSWSNPAGLSAIDSVYIHWDTVPAMGWVHDTTLSGSEDSCSVTLPFTSEGTFRVMISTSWDSAGIHHEEDALIDTFVFNIDPPDLSPSSDTVRSQLLPIAWTNPSGLTSSDSVYLHIDTVSGSAWVLDMTMASNTTNANVDLQPAEGVYKYMLSTSLDSTGIMDAANRVIDTVVFRIVPPAITTSFDTTETLAPTITWNAAEGMTGSDYYFVYDDTVTGAWGWTFREKVLHPSASATLSYGRIGTYRYRITTSFDSLAVLEPENGTIDTIALVDTTGPSGVSFSIVDNNGATPDADPPLAITVTGADSMRLGTGSDTVSVLWEPVAAVDSIAIEAGGEGLKYVFIQFKDSADNRTEWYIDSTVYDTTAPAGGTISVSDIDGYTADADPHLSLTATGADSMRIAEVGDTVITSWKVYASIDSIDLSTGGDGLKRVYAQFKDAAGNLTTWVYDSTTLDMTIPTGSCTITDNGGYTADADPELSITAAGADSMRLGLETDTASAIWKLYASLDSVTISTGGEGSKCIWIQFADRAGNRSSWSMACTEYDTTAPTGSVAFEDPDGYTNKETPHLVITATAADSMRMGSSADTASALWKQYATKDSVSITTGGEGVKTVYGQFRDLAGNVSSWSADTIVYDTTAPAGAAISVNDVNGYTTDPDPLLSLTATGADSMRIAEVGDTAITTWKQFASTDSIDLSIGGDGIKRVYVQFKDVAENLTDWVHDSTLLDATVPTGTISVSDRNGYTNDTDPPITISAIGADSMRIGMASDTASLLWTVYSSVDSVAVAVGGEGTKRIHAQFKDISGNKSDWTMDSTLYDTTMPGGTVSTSGTFNYLTWTGFVSGTATDALTGIDSLNITVERGDDGWFWNGTGWQSMVSSVALLGATTWQMPLPDTVLGNGNYIMTVSVVDGAGNRDINAATGSFTWYKRPKARFSISPVTGFVPLTVVFTDSSDGVVTSRQWLLGDSAVDTTAILTHVYQDVGWYDVSLTVTGPGGSDTVAKDSCILVNDTTGPQPLSSVTATALNCSTAVITWAQPTETDVDSVSINVSSNGFVVTPSEGERIERLDARKLRDTLSGFSPEGVVLFVTAFLKNDRGYWSYAGTGSSAVVTLPDGSAPFYSLTVAVQSAGDTTVQITVDAATVAEPGLRQRIGFNSTRKGAIDAMTAMQYRDTLFTTALQTVPGWRYVASAVEDSAGNRSEVRIDSCLIENLPPIVTVSCDTLLLEDTLWEAEITTGDFNNDQVEVVVTEAPEGMVLSGGILTWTPDDAHVGEQTVVLTGKDARGGTGNATLSLTIENREETPHIKLVGDTVVDEDARWQAMLQVYDPDPGDSVVLKVEKKPVWVTVAGDAFSGIPLQEHVGSETLVCVVTDRTGLRDTLQTVLTVRNVNDTPVIAGYVSRDTLFEKASEEFMITVDDPDEGDSLLFTWVKPVRWITAGTPVRDGSGKRWSIALQAAPQQSDTGLTTFTIAFTDREHTVATLRDTIRVLDTDDPPAPPNISKLVAGGAVQYTLATSDDYDTDLIYAVTLRSLDDTTRFWSDRSSRGQFRFYPLADATYRLSATVIDQAGLETDPVYDTLLIIGSSRRVLADTSWGMVAVPARYRVDALAHTSYLLHWDESISERQVYHYYLQKDELPNVEPGNGYWRKGNASDTIDIRQDEFIRNPVSIALKKSVSGWNQIASPYPYPVIWRGKSSVLWKWNGATGDFEESDSILEPWAGYWLQSDVSDSVEIDTVPFFSGKKLAKRRKVWFNGKNQWVLQAVLTTEEGTDAENRFGVLPGAKDGYDRLDRPEPPRMVDRASLYFPRSGWKRGVAKYASDIRRRWDDVNMFEFGISGTSRSGTANVRFEGLGSSIPLHLFVMSADSFVPIDPDNGITFPVTGADSYRTVVVVDNVAALQRMPLRFSLGNAYPNPFCPSTNINYVLPYRWAKDGRMNMRDYVVAIELFDIKGRKVRTLVHRKMRPGSYQAYWDGKSSSGRVVASGHYYCRLKAAPFEAVRKLTLVRQ